VKLWLMGRVDSEMCNVAMRFIELWEGSVSRSLTYKICVIS
jgi:hypothetical protein